ncbi:MAG: hypothetical protein EXR76_19345 [Myxococcales bacterium]|nr:hypothetical protein [Myxococcales bacterium]
MSKVVVSPSFGALFASFVFPAFALPKPESGRGHTVAVSISPLHLIMSVVELQAEYLAHPQFSASLIGGYGSIEAESSLGETLKFHLLEVGTQARGYFYGTSEEGAYGGLEVLYISVDVGTADVSGVASGTSVGGFAGYKWTWENFFIDSNFGLQNVGVTAGATDGAETAKAEKRKIGALANFGLGLSF